MRLFLAYRKAIIFPIDEAGAPWYNVWAGNIAMTLGSEALRSHTSPVLALN
jgi:hypothetical protein